MTREFLRTRKGKGSMKEVKAQSGDLQGHKRCCLCRHGRASTGTSAARKTRENVSLLRGRGLGDKRQEKKTKIFSAFAALVLAGKICLQESQASDAGGKF